MATIKAIEGRTVHQIQSGQVIVDLCSVVKELVENSLDAGASSIDVRFKNQGLDSIEVQDNGDGISPHNYDTLALKHHTSKLSTYSDLSTLQTFGFRGEALSSLCALSNFTVTTCMLKDAPKGTKLDFEISGKLKGTSVVAAQKGTTVSVENLFNNLPVRRRELERNIKREWNRVVGVLGQYACIQTGIKLSVTQQAGKGKKSTLFSTKGNQTTRENIVNVFGAKTLTALIPLDLMLEMESTSAPSQRWSTQENRGKKEIRIVGHISRPISGEGRQTPDRQMFFVNARPCALPQVSKAFNEVYKSFNGSQSPFIFANIELDTHLYDVNVSPDKRTILLHDQNRMLEGLKEKLMELFESRDHTVPISQMPVVKQPGFKQLTITKSTETPSRVAQDIPSPETIVEATEADESGNESTSSREDPRVLRGQVSGDEAPRRPFNANTRRAVSRSSLSNVGDGVSLIGNWLGRKADDREEQRPQAVKSAAQVIEGLSKDKRLLVEKLRREREEAEAAPDASANSSIATAHSITTPASSRIQPSDLGVDQGLEEIPTASEPSPTKSEIPIPVLISSTKPSSSIADRFSRNAGAQRRPAEIATITIGDYTTTSTIGTPCPNRSRTDRAPTVSRIRGPSQPPGTALPSFGSSLNQRFAAPGTALPVPGEGEDSDAEADECASARTTSAPSRQLDTLLEQSEDVEIIGIIAGADEMAESPASGDVAVKKEPEDINSSLTPPNVEEGTELLDEIEKRAQDEAQVQSLIQDAERTAAAQMQDAATRTKSLLRAKKKDSTLNLVKTINTNTAKIGEQLKSITQTLNTFKETQASQLEGEAFEAGAEKAEEKLSLTISKSDFAMLKIIGQFNLGFILASRCASSPSASSSSSNSLPHANVEDNMFIIDQHASDEKYNFERLQATTIVQSQRLVHPKTLDLTAMEEEIVIENLKALETNGFLVRVDVSGEKQVGQRCELLALPLSRETAFDLKDLEELISLLAENPTASTDADANKSVPRPSKVRKMFAMRACRSSIMIGRTLTKKQMGKVVKNLGELDKPWNCPHGRPTMRHLTGLAGWDSDGWCGDGYSRDGGRMDLAGYVSQNRGGSEEEPDEDEENSDEAEEMEEGDTLHEENESVDENMEESDTEIV